MRKLFTTVHARFKNVTYFTTLLATCSMFVSCSNNYLVDELEAIFNGHTEAAIPGNIDFTSEALYPEGVSHDAIGRRFLVTSLNFGTIGSVAYNGMYTPFIEDADLISTIGIKVDETRKRVLVAVSDPGAGVKSSPATAGQLAALGIYNLTTGTRIKLVNLGALKPGQGHFANDITIDPQGNAYITDSFSPFIYKVDVNGNASIFFENENFVTNPGQFGFNGIVYHPSGYLIVGFSKENKLYKIPLSNPAAYSAINLNTQLMGPDGLLLSNDGNRLIVVNNAGGIAPGKVMSFTSEDMWNTGTLSTTFETEAVFPTTATSYKKEVFVLHAYLNRLFSGADPVKDFTIQKVPFANINF